MIDFIKKNQLFTGAVFAYKGEIYCLKSWGVHNLISGLCQTWNQLESKNKSR